VAINPADASTPVRFTGTPAQNVDITSASFTAPSGATLVLCVSGDTSSGGVTNTLSASDSGGLTWTSQGKRDGNENPPNGGISEIFTATTVSAVARTVSVRRTTTGGGTNRLQAKCYVVTGQDASPIGNAAENGTTTNDATVTGPTTTAANSYVFYAATEWNQLGTPTSADLTIDAFDNGSQISGLSGYKSVAGIGGTTANLNAGGAGTAAWGFAAIEIKEDPGGGGVSVSPIVPAGDAAGILAVWETLGILGGGA
jgi:hypothetical protein